MLFRRCMTWALVHWSQLPRSKSTRSTNTKTQLRARTLNDNQNSHVLTRHQRRFSNGRPRTEPHNCCNACVLQLHRSEYAIASLVTLVNTSKLETQSRLIFKTQLLTPDSQRQPTFPRAHMPPASLHQWSAAHWATRLQKYTYTCYATPKTFGEASRHSLCCRK